MNRPDPATRWVAHIDMDAFFASVEQLTRPTLQGRPVLVGGAGGRGVVAGCSYEARAFGARSAMPMSQAVKLCVGRAVVVRPRFAVYKLASKKIFEVLSLHADVIEQLSVDEGFAEPEELRGATPEQAREWGVKIQAAIKGATGLPASVGMAQTKLDAKIASDLAKPEGVKVVSLAARADILGVLPVGEVWGIGKVAQARLAEVGVRTIGQFIAMDPTDVRSLLGTVGVEIQRMASGDDTRPVAPRAQSKQISAERTLDADVRTTAETMPQVEVAAKLAHARLLKDGRAAKTITAKVRTADFQLHTRSATLSAPTDSAEAIIATAKRVLPRPEDVGAIRLVGVGLSGLISDRQEVLFPEMDNEIVTSRISVPVGGDAEEDSESGAEPVPRGSLWHNTQDVQHPDFGHGWVQGTGDSVVSVRFETAATGKGRARTFAIDDPTLSPADPINSLGWNDAASPDE